MNAVRMRRLMVVTGAENKEQLAQRIAAAGYDLTTAESEERALQELGAGSWDLAIVDQCPESWDAPALASRIRDDFGVPVLFVGEAGDDAYLHRVRAADPYGYVCKPLTDGNLRIQIDLALHRIDLERDHALSLPGRLVAHEHLKGIEAMLPICSGCSKIHSQDGRWQKVEEYFGEHAQVQFTHSFCPACEQRLYGQKSYATPRAAKH